MLTDKRIKELNDLVDAKILSEQKSEKMAAYFIEGARMAFNSIRVELGYKKPPMADPVVVDSPLPAEKGLPF